MADDYKFRSDRSSDPYRRAPESPRSEFSNSSDPLAELARLIGQDPYAPTERSSLREPPLSARDLLPRDPPSARDYPPPREMSPRDLLPRDLPPRDYASRDLPSRDLPSRDLPSRGYSSSPSSSEWAPSLGPSADRRYDYDSASRGTGYDSSPRSSGRDSYPDFGDIASSRAPGRESLAPRDDYYYAGRGGTDRYPQSSPLDDLAPQAPAFQAAREETRWPDPQAYAEPPYDEGPAGEAQPEQSAHPEYADQPVHAAAAEHGDAEYDDEQYYQDDAPLQPEDEDAYDDAPSAYRRGGLVTAVALIACALLGTAGAYAYRSYAHPTAKEPPPVITADQSTPTKVIPAPSDARSGKAINERFATAASGSEQLVSRQEEPVAIRDPGTSTAPRVVLPAPVQPAQPGASIPQTTASTPPVQAAPQPAPAATPPASASSQTPPGGEPKRVRTVTIRPDGADQSGRPVSAPTTPPAPRAAAPTPPAPGASTPPAPRSGGPLSLDANEPRARTATAPRDSFSSYSPSGGYVVQLSSQKSEGEAHASFRALQSKFPSELGNRQVIIRRADLGSKGVVYRTNVGPFGTAQEAQQFCASYKAAGGQCIVPTN